MLLLLINPIHTVFFFRFFFPSATRGASEALSPMLLQNRSAMITKLTQDDADNNSNNFKGSFVFVTQHVVIHDAIYLILLAEKIFD